jgi:hypothetical protein
LEITKEEKKMNRIKLSGLELKKLSAGLLVSVFIIGIFAITPVVSGRNHAGMEIDEVCRIEGPASPTMAIEPLFTLGTTNTVTWSNSDFTAVEFFMEVYRDPYEIPPKTGEALMSAAEDTSGWVTSPSYTFTELEDGITYYYRIKARDLCGTESRWSDFTISTMDSMAPPVPEFNPVNKISTSSVELTWNEVVDTGIGMEQYMVEVYSRPQVVPKPPAETINEYMPEDNEPVVYLPQDNEPTELIQSSGWITGTEYRFESLNDGDFLFVVKSRDGFYHESDWSEGIKVTLQNNVIMPEIEEPPKLPSPPPKTGESVNAADDGIGIGLPTLPPKPTEDTERTILEESIIVQPTIPNTQKSTVFFGGYAHSTNGIGLTIPE